MAATLQTFGGGTTDFILDPGNGAKPLPNTPYTIVDAVTMLPATGLQDASGATVTQLTSDSVGRFAGSALLEGAEFYLKANGSDGVVYTFGPMVSTTAVADTLGLAPQLDSIAASASASALSAKQAQAAAQAAADKAAGLIPLDVTKTTPQFLTSLTLTGGDVFQYAYKDPTTGEFYVSMNATGTQAGRETATLCRCGPDGRLLDYMTLTDAGHGANLAFERAGSDMFVYINWQEALSGGSGNQLVRFQYRAGATLTRAQTTYFTTVPKFVAGAQSTNIAVDWANDWVAQRISVDSTHDTYVRRRWSEMLAGVDKVYNTVGPIVVNPPTMQGMATLGDNLYFYSGTGGLSDAEPNQLQRVSWATGQVTATVDTAPLGLVNGVTPGSYNEPEGVSVYVDPATGAASLIVGVVTGVKGARNYNLFTFSPPVGGLTPNLSPVLASLPRVPAATWDNFTGGVALHGMGGMQAPRSTVEAARGSVAAGCGFLDADMRLTADNVPMLAHDNDVTLGTNLASGSWRDQQSSNLGMVRWQPSRYIGGVWPDLQVVTIAKFLDEFGGKVPILLEPKNQTVLADWQASITAVAPLIRARRLERSVMISLYGTLTATHAKTVKDAGLMLNVYLDSAVPSYNDPALIPSYQAAGVDMISLSGLTSDATIAAWQASGMKVTVSANGRRAAWDHLKAIGVNATVDDYAVYLDRLNARAVTDPWRNGQWGNGDQPAASHTRPTLLTNGLRFSTKGTDNRQMMLAGDFAPLPTAFTADLVVTVDTVPSGGKLGLAVCQQTDASFTDVESDPTGYQLWLTMGGVAQIYTRAANTSTSRATSVQTPVTVTAAQTVYVRVQVTSTTVSISRLDAPNGNVMVSASYADTTWRGGYVHLMHFFNTGTGSYTVKSLTVTAN